LSFNLLAQNVVTQSIGIMAAFSYNTPLGLTGMDESALFGGEFMLLQHPLLLG
jgi:hypothetical protein